MTREKQCKKGRCKWCYVGTETFPKEGFERSVQWATFICSECGHTKAIQVSGYFCKELLNKERKR